MKKIMISLFILVSMLGFAEGENEGSAIREVPIIENQGAQTESTGAASNGGGESQTPDDGGETVENPETPKEATGVREYRPQSLIQLDEQMKKGTRSSIIQLNARYEQELNAYLKSVSYNSDVIFYLANEYMMLNNYSRANKIFLKDNRDLRNVFGAATTYRFMGQHRNAIDKYSQAISMNSGFAESYLGRGLSYRNLNEYDNAVSDLKTYISKTGAHDGYVALADVYFKMGKNKEAYAIASQGIAKYGNSGILKVLANNILKNKID